MAGRVDHPCARAAKRDGVTLLHCLVQLRQSVRIGCRADHFGAGEPRTHLVDPGNVIGVVMRQQDQVEPTAGLLQRGDDRLGLSRIHDGNRSGAAVAQHPGIVVGQDGDGLCCDCHERSLAPAGATENRRSCYTRPPWQPTPTPRPTSTPHPEGRLPLGCSASD
jgi:hypothetical protein